MPPAQPLLLLASALLAAAFSSGGGSGDADDGSPLAQTCDALTLCTIPDNGTTRCPDGMHMVAPPVRSDVYVLATEDGSASYTPGQLLPLTISVTRRRIVGKRDLGATLVGNESSKYIGLLLYAVSLGDAAETKVGSWEIPLEVPPRFWLPPDLGCAAQAVMHANAAPKAFVERFIFRAPEAGSGTLVFRGLVKQGDTNAGAFYWLGAGDGQPPAAGIAGGDLTLTEGPSPPASSVAWRRAGAGETCEEACEQAALACDGAALASVQKAAAFASAVVPHQICRLPLLESCDGPSASRLRDGYCWYAPTAKCAATSEPATCEAPPADDSALGARLCACTDASRRRALLEVEGTGTSAAGAAAAAAVAEAPPTSDAAELSAAHLAAARGCPNARLASRPGAQPCPSGTRALADSAARAEGVQLAGPFGSAALVVAVAALAGAMLAQRALRRRGAPQASVGLLAFFADVGSAHNWINAPRSRTGKLSMTVPCPKRQRFSHPDIVVNRGQPFMIEWQVGHPRSHNFFAMVAAEHEGKLASHTEAMLWEYISDAPLDAAKFEEPYWDKHHVGYVGSGGGATSEAAFQAQDKIKIEPGDVVAPQRPWAFECPYAMVVDPNRTQENPGCSECNSGPTGIADCGSVARWKYPDYDVASDVRVAYYNPKLPWIEAVWMYKNPRNHWPKQFDIARMTFPTHVQSVGQHIVHWMWRGYRDCIDVDILPDNVPVPNTSGAMYGYKASAQDEWIRLDHAQVPKGKYSVFRHSKSNCGRGWPMYKFQTCFVIPPEGEIIFHRKDGYSSGNWDRSFALQRCKDRCTETSLANCQGVQVVPLEPPPAVLFNTTDVWNIPWGVGDCVEQGTHCLKAGTPGHPKGSLVCYPIDFDSFPSAEIAEPWEVAPDDPRDEVFYSTLFLRTEAWHFDGPTLGSSCGDACASSGGQEVAPWRFGDACLSCGLAQSILDNFSAATVPTWTLDDTCELCSRPQVAEYTVPSPPASCSGAGACPTPTDGAPPPPPPPAPPSCVEPGLTAIEGYPCALQLGAMELRYELKPERLRAQLYCAMCTEGWLGLGFAATPGVMLGATAVLGWTGGNVSLYSLDSKDPASAVTLLPPAAQQALSTAHISITDEGVTLTVVVADAALAPELFAASLLYAAGSSATAPSYHGTTRGARPTSLLSAAGGLSPLPPPLPPVPPPSNTPIAAAPERPPPASPQLQLADSSAAVTELLGLQGLELAAASFVAGGLLVALLCGAGILARRYRYRRDQKHLAETRTSMVAVDRGKAAAPLSPSTPPQPPPAPPRLPPGWEQHETDEGDMYYHNAATGATRWDRP